MNISNRTGVSTFAIRTSQRTDQKLQKSFHLCHLKRISKYFFQRFKKNKTPDTQASQKSTRQMTQTEDIKMVVTHDRQERQPITAPTRKWRFRSPQTHLWLQKVQFSASTFVVKNATFAKPQNVRP
ncbi:MAG: hypothetical protein HQ490_02680 [Lutibacter sp.]|nr:hypothetical protein [Lutibacter sp.]